ncbi:uncharacterized protein [Periplaneta americana]|uniref:uncharacterized protein n=1 Tax=Periplaneta americana TaxID=6978 RepID=UPI0037E905C7
MGRNSLQQDKMGRNSLQQDKMGRKSLQQDKMGRNSLQQDKMGRNSLQQDKMGRNSLQQDKMGRNSLQQDKMGRNSLQQDKMGRNSLQQDKMGWKSLQQDKIGRNSLQQDKIGRNSLQQDKIGWNSSGERGYLEGLASRYADLFNTHYGDVLEHLEDLRRREWEDLSPRIRVLVGTTPDTPPSDAYTPSTTGPVGQHTPQGHHGITTSHSQPIYVPGKYSPSSCLSDKEEDEIYGFGYGIYGKQMLQRQQQQKMIISPQVNYQSCLSPRSAYFYEFPPNEQSGSQQTGKKKTSFSRFLRGLKTGHRKEKNSGSSPRHSRASARGPHAGRVGTPDSVAESMLPSIVDPRDYDRLRFMQMNGGTGNSFEETIHRLKVQEVLKKRERFHKEHEEILRDIRQGLLQIGREGMRPTVPADDTYMYDDDARCSGIGPHWYDEPPYESDPEDFLMGTNSSQPLPPSAIQNGRVCFTLDLRSDQRGEGIISLRTAGDISIPRDPSANGSSIWLQHAQGIPSTGGSTLTPRGSARRGLLVPQSGPYPATIIPLGGPQLRESRGDRGSGDYAGSDVQSIGSRLSTMSIDTTRSEQLEGHGGISSPSYLSAHGGKGRPFRKLAGYTSRSSASEEGLSPSQSSDYEDQEDLESGQQPNTSQSPGDSGGRSGGVSLVGRMRGLRQDVQKKISRLRASGPNPPPPPAPASTAQEGNERREGFPSTSSVESLPSGSGSSTQALVPAAGSNHSSLSAEDRDCSPVGAPTPTAVVGPVIGKARALVDYTPSPYDKDALRFKKGDVIDVIAMNASGLWRGILHSRVGNFKFINVELLSDKMCQRVAASLQRSAGKYSGRRCGSTARGRPQSVEELLQRMNLEEHISVFVLNGYEDLELFKDLEAEDLDYLGITNPEHRAKILTAVELLHDYDSPDSPEDTDGEGPVSSSEDEDDDAGSVSQQSECSASQQQQQQQQHPMDVSKSSFRRLQFPRDSGCYDSSSGTMKDRVHTHHRHHHHHKKSPALGPGATLPHHHHHHHKSCRSASKMKEGGAGSLRPQGERTHQCSGSSSREIPNNLDSGLIASLQHPLLQQCSGGGVEGSDLQYRGGGGKGAASEVADSDKQGLIIASSLPQQQSFLPNIPVTSSTMSASPVTQLPPADFSGMVSGGRSLVSASSVSSSVSSSSPIRTCATSSFGTEFKSDSYVVARGKLVAVESCRKAGSPSTPSPVGSVRCSNSGKKQQVHFDSPSSKRSPSNPFCAITTNASVVDVSPQAAASPPPCGGNSNSGTIEDTCETNTKLTMVKYVVGGSSDLGLGCESGNVMGMGRGGCCLSEKSSDSGVSSSSLSSANPKDSCGRKEGRAVVAVGQSVVESPTRGFANYGGCIGNNHRSSPTASTNKGLVLQGPDKTSYQ